MIWMIGANQCFLWNYLSGKCCKPEGITKGIQVEVGSNHQFIWQLLFPKSSTKYVQKNNNNNNSGDMDAKFKPKMK